MEGIRDSFYLTKHFISIMYQSMHGLNVILKSDVIVLLFAAIENKNMFHLLQVHYSMLGGVCAYSCVLK